MGEKSAGRNFLGSQRSDGAHASATVHPFPDRLLFDFQFSRGLGLAAEVLNELRIMRT